MIQIRPSGPGRELCLAGSERSGRPHGIIEVAARREARGIFPPSGLRCTNRCCFRREARKGRNASSCARGVVSRTTGRQAAEWIRRSFCTMRLTEAPSPRRAARQVCKLLKNEAPRMMMMCSWYCFFSFPEKVKNSRKLSKLYHLQKPINISFRERQGDDTWTW